MEPQETMEGRIGSQKSTKEKSSHKEGNVAKAIESETSKLPSDLFLWTAVGAMTASVALQLAKQKHAGLFIGQWVAPLLIFGLYNKLVKQHGHDKEDNQ